MSGDQASFGHPSVHVGGDWTVRCHAYDAQTPIFDIDAGRVALSVSVRDCDATSRAVEFARALAREAQVFATGTTPPSTPLPPPTAGAPRTARPPRATTPPRAASWPLVLRRPERGRGGWSWYLQPPPFLPWQQTLRGLDLMASLKRPAAGQLAQVDNPDPFAVPVWRSPVYETPHAVIWAVQFFRLLWRLTWFILTHPVPDAVAAILIYTWIRLGWRGVAGLVLVVAALLVTLRLARPDWFTRFVGNPARNQRRWWFYGAAGMPR